MCVSQIAPKIILCIQYAAFSTEGPYQISFQRILPPTDLLFRIFKEVRPFLSSASKDQLKTKGNITLHVKIGGLLTSVLCTAVENWAIDVLLVAAFIDERIIALLPDGQKASVRRFTSVAIVKQYECLLTLSLQTIVRRMRIRRLSLKKHDQGSTIKHSNTV